MEQAADFRQVQVSKCFIYNKHFIECLKCGMNIITISHTCLIQMSNLNKNEAPCAHLWQIWRASVLFPTPGAPSISTTLCFSVALVALIVYQC